MDIYCIEKVTIPNDRNITVIFLISAEWRDTLWDLPVPGQPLWAPYWVWCTSPAPLRAPAASPASRYCSPRRRRTCPASSAGTRRSPTDKSMGLTWARGTSLDTQIKHSGPSWKDMGVEQRNCSVPLPSTFPESSPSLSGHCYGCCWSFLPDLALSCWCHLCSNYNRFRQTTCWTVAS